MFETDYARLKSARDPRWTNAKKCDTYKTLAEAEARASEVRAERWRQADRATADRLAKAKAEVTALAKTARRVVARRNVDCVLEAVGPADGRAAYERMDTAAAVERSLKDKLSRGRHRLQRCRDQLAEKTARMTRLRTELDDMRARRLAELDEAAAATDRPASSRPLLSAATVDKTVDGLRLANRQATRARDLLTDNVALLDALNGQLMADVRQQAAAVIELIAYGSAAQRDTAEMDRLYCAAVAEHEATVRRKAVVKGRLKNNIVVLESNRKKMIVQEMTRQKEIEENVDLVFGNLNASSSHFGSTISRRVTTNDDVMPLIDWIYDGSMAEQMYPRKYESRAKRLPTLSSLKTKPGENPSKTDDQESLNSYEDYVFPSENVNQFVFGNREHTRAMEAAHYVCETLGFDNIHEVLQYFYTVKSVELRVKKMVNVRKSLVRVVRTSVDAATEVKADLMNSVPEAILRLDAHIERVQRDGLEVQAKRLEEVDEKLTEYGELFNELWFHLDSLTGKLDRCQVPVVRKYQLFWSKRSNKREDETLDAQRMLEGLRLAFSGRGGDEDDSAGGGRGASGDAERAAAFLRCDPASASADVPDGRTSASGLRLDAGAADACRKLLTTLHTKVKSCMVHIGGDFDVADGQQLVARAHFEFNQQFHLQRAALERDDRNRRARSRLEARAALAAAHESNTAARAAAGLLTREQTKQQSDDIVKYFLTPKDTEVVLRTRKPISFRRSKIIV